MKKHLLISLIVIAVFALAPAMWAQMGGGMPGGATPGTPGGGSTGTGVIGGIVSAMPIPNIAPMGSAEIPIGPDGTAYLLRPQITISLGFVRSIEYKTEIVAVGLDKSTPTKWSKTIDGLSQRAEVGDNTLYVVLSQPIAYPMPMLGAPTTTAMPVVAGAGETQLLLINTTDPNTIKTVKVQGQILGLQVRKIKETEYVYLTVVRPASPGKSSTVGLVILDSSGVQFKALDAETDAQEQ